MGMTIYDDVFWPMEAWPQPILLTIPEVEAITPDMVPEIDSTEPLDYAQQFPGGREAWARAQRRLERDAEARPTPFEKDA